MSNSDLFHTYQITTPSFTGPLDLLLNLIEKAELDITTVALAHVTDQYIQQIKSFDGYMVEEMSTFLVVAAKLIQIKSLALLPVPSIQSDIELDTAESLVRALIEYKKYKQVALHLSWRQTQRLSSYLRLDHPIIIEKSLDLRDVTVNDLAVAAYNALTRIEPEGVIKKTITPQIVSVREKIKLITEELLKNNITKFWKILSIGKKTKADIAVTFLALLELVKQRRINIYQKTIFGDIEIQKDGDWDSSEEFELEFGE
jgi:segregation and condensation protein A